MCNVNIIPVILSGGTGSRLWPLSRMSYPKQFLKLCSSNTLIQDTLLRVSNLSIKKNIVICNEEHRFIVAEQLREINQLHNSSIILEPTGKNTAPAIALASFLAQNLSNQNEDNILLVLAADHYIADPEKFIDSINESIDYALNDRLVTFGITPYKPETGYGYIKKGEALSRNVYNVESFVEKPDAVNAQLYINSGSYLWNSGIFLFKASAFLSELEIFEPEIFNICKRSMANISFDNDFIRPQKDVFERCPSKSIDYAVMEHTPNSVMAASNMNWNDVGSWTSLWETVGKDTDGNYISGDVIPLNTSDCYIQSENGVVATIGVKDLIIINTADAVLITNKADVQDVKIVYEKMLAEGRVECVSHQTVYRPWGCYTTIGSGDGYQIRRLSINIGCSIDKQVHYQRAEHWIVVKGSAEVTKNDEKIILQENHSTFISPGDTHIVKNICESILEIIEIQSGINLTENDNYNFSTRG